MHIYYPDGVFNMNIKKNVFFYDHNYKGSLYIKHNVYPIMHLAGSGNASGVYPFTFMIAKLSG